MTKLSKSDTTPEDEAREAAARANLRQLRSNHFAEGSFVIYNNERAEVVARPGGGFMLVLYEDGTTEILRPLALQWEN